MDPARIDEKNLTRKNHRFVRNFDENGKVRRGGGEEG